MKILLLFIMFLLPSYSTFAESRKAQLEAAYKTIEAGKSSRDSVRKIMGTPDFTRDFPERGTSLDFWCEFPHFMARQRRYFVIYHHEDGLVHSKKRHADAYAEPLKGKCHKFVSFLTENFELYGYSAFVGHIEFQSHDLQLPVRKSGYANFFDTMPTKEELRLYYFTRAFRKDGGDWSILDSDPFKCEGVQRYFPELKKEILSASIFDKPVFVFKDVSRPTRADFCLRYIGKRDHGDGVLEAVEANWVRVVREIDAQVAEINAASSAKATNDDCGVDCADSNPPLGRQKQKDQALPELGVVGSGTGFFVSKKGHIVTNNHVVEQCESIKFTTQGAEVPAVLLARDKVNDVALLKAELTPPGVLHVGEEKAELLERIFVAGFPFGSLVSSSLKVTSGIVSSLAGIDDNYSNIQIDAAIQQGNSGGPIVNEKGNVIAIAVGKLSTKYFLSRYGTVPEGSNFGVKGTVVGNLLEANQVKVVPPNKTKVETQVLSKSLTDSTINLTCLAFPEPEEVEAKAEIPEKRTASSLGLKTIQIGAAVTVTGADGIAFDAGMRPGDIILRLRTRGIESIASLELAASRVESGDSVPVLILRPETSRRLFLTLKVP